MKLKYFRRQKCYEQKSISDYDNAGKVRVIVKDANGTHYDDVNMSEINGIKTGGYSKRKRPVYEDCRLLSPDGQLLCRINKKKLDWYVHRGLGSNKFIYLFIEQLLFLRILIQ